MFFFCFYVLPWSLKIFFESSLLFTIELGNWSWLYENQMPAKNSYIQISEQRCFFVKQHITNLKEWFPIFTSPSNENVEALRQTDSTENEKHNLS